MDIDLLKYFLSVAQTQSIRESASLIGISAAGLSKGIKNLESKLGYEVIETHGRGIRLTHAGNELAKDLGPKVGDLEKVLYRAKGGTPHTAAIRIATFEIFSTHIIAKSMNANQELSTVEIIESIPGEIEDVILKQRADIGISINPAPRNGLTYLKAAQFKSKIFVASKSPMLKLSTEDLPFVVPFPPDKGPVSRAIGLDGWPAEKPRQIAYRVSMMETALSLCKMNKAAGFFPEPVVAVYNEFLLPQYQLVAHSARVPADALDVFLVVRNGEENTKAVKFLAKELRMFAKLST